MIAYSLVLGSRERGKFRPSDDRLLQQHFPDGFTIKEAAGAWFDPVRKKIIREESREILVCAARRAPLLKWCLVLGRGLKQKELLITIHGRPIVVQIGSPSRTAQKVVR